MTGEFTSEAERLAARMLGPAWPELDCDECFDRLDAYVELELAGADADAKVPGMRAHLQGCDACREDRDSMLALLREDPGAATR